MICWRYSFSLAMSRYSILSVNILHLELVRPNLLVVASIEHLFALQGVLGAPLDLFFIVGVPVVEVEPES
jgi:hypothetical protein